MACDNCNSEYNPNGYGELAPCSTGCTTLVNAACILYTGVDIPCLGIVSGVDTIRTALIKIMDRACELYAPEP